MNPFEKFTMNVPTIHPDEEIKLRCLEAATKTATDYPLDMARKFWEFVIEDREEELEEGE